MRFLIALFLIAAASPALADLRGHGGPVRALAVSPDGERLASGSFDTTAILWDRDAGIAQSVLRLHEDSVNAMAFLADGRLVSGGQDGRVVLWPGDNDDYGGGEGRVLTRHDAPVVSIAVSPDGASIASASWDGTLRVVPVGGGEPRVLEGHEGNVNAVAYLPDGRLVSAGYDLTLRIWPQDSAATVVTLPTPLNALAVAEDGEIAVAGADGVVRFVDGDGALVGEVATAPVPVVALAISADGATIASSTIDGSVWLIERESRTVRLTVQDADSPVWSLAFDPRGGTLFAGGGDRIVREWDPRTGRRLNEDAVDTDAETAFDDSRGAEVFAACSACHTVTQDGANRAGPTLHGIFGRRIATAPGYDYSEALEGMDIVWTPETVAELFDVGPNHYTPGTKMPEQRITNPDDRAALIDFLKRTTQ